MQLWDRAQVVAQLARSALSWVQRDTHYPSPVPDNPKFMSPYDAVRLIRDGDVVATSGLGGNQRASIVYAAIREAFEESAHPAGLTVVNLGGCGGRGIVPGTLEELGQRGLCRRLITGHFETFHAMLELAEAGQCELQCIPQGTLALLLAGLARGRSSRVSTTGVGTFIDPRVGPGSPVARSARESLVTVERGRLRYRLPPIDVAVFNVPAADRRGNLYVKHSAMIGESREIAGAAKRNRGRVIANVGVLVDEGYDRVFLPARDGRRRRLLPRHRADGRRLPPRALAGADHRERHIDRRRAGRKSASSISSSGSRHGAPRLTRWSPASPPRRCSATCPAPPT